MPATGCRPYGGPVTGTGELRDGLHGGAAVQKRSSLTGVFLRAGGNPHEIKEITAVNLKESREK